jgi:phenylalanyl-tRNA synthetase beta chain
MRVPVQWLQEYCRPALDVAALADRLAMTGTEVERVEHYGVGALERFVVGRVLEAGQHPDADRLSVCSVDVGDGEASQIVCGAPNVAAGQTVAVARPGAVMPDGTRLKVAKLRGQKSHGMILAEDELAIGTEHAGILVLEPDGLEPGMPLEQVLPISTDVLVLEITPNRPDCLGIYGVAREVHAATGAPLAAPPWADDPGSDGELSAVTITVQCPDLCPRFTARMFEDVTIGPSPLWLKARLMAAGQRPISNVVDITNYVMLLTGQPLHAFDLDQVAGAELTIRRARDGEQVETLDGQTRTLDHDMVLIADAQGPTSIAGVMGGARSEVGEDTNRVLMEVANWDGANIHRTSLKLGLRSEASTRYEKQLQPEQAMEAQAMATRLMIELCGARLVPGTIDVGGPGPAPLTIHLRDARIAGLLGAPIPRERSRDILTALEFTVADAPDGLDVEVPPFRRGDVTREADLIEEVARLNGLENLPATLPATRRAAEAALAGGAGGGGAALAGGAGGGAAALAGGAGRGGAALVGGPGQAGAGRLTARQKLRRAGVDALTAQGLHEIVGWSFVGPELATRLRLSERDAIELENPMSGDQSRLRTTLLGSLLDVARGNRAHGAGAVRLFEAGAVYLPRPDAQPPAEPYHVGAVLIGPVRSPTWREGDPRPADFFAAKGVLQGMLDTLRVPWSVEPAPEPFLHPGRAARILVAGEPVGWLGEIHPLVAADWGQSDPIAAFELDLDAVVERAPLVTLYKDVTSFPEVREDLAVIVSDAVSAAQVLDLVRRTGAPLLAGAEVFDVYRDVERIGAGNVSLALRLSFRAPDRTLTDKDVAQRRAKIADALARELGGRVRDA